MLDDPLSFDPRRGGDIASSTIHFALFEGLLRMEPGKSWAPGIAKKVVVSEDKKTYTFYLRKSYWSDGSPVTAESFAFAWKTILDPSMPSPHGNLLYPIKNARAAKRGDVPLSEVGVYARNTHTLVVELEKPTPYFLDILTFCALSPVPHYTVQTHPDWAEKPTENHFISNGPYRLKYYTPHNKIILEKNPHYFRPETVEVDEVHITFVRSENTALEMFEQGALDVVGASLTPIPIDAVRHLTGRIDCQPIAATSGLFFNTESYPLNNVHIRKALAYAIKRQDLIDNVTQMNEIPATTAIPPILNSNAYPLLLDDAPDEARKHFAIGLSELGITVDEFPKVSIVYSANDFNHKIAQVFQERWKQVLGIDIKLSSTEFLVYLNRMSSKDYQIGMNKWSYQFFDPINYLERFKYVTEPKNFTNWQNETFTSLLDASMTKSDKDRLEHLQLAEAILLEEVPTVPIFHWQSSIVLGPAVKSVYTSPTGFVLFHFTKL